MTLWSPYARNARLHSDEQLAEIAASIDRFGFNNPILIDAAGVIVAGHGRVIAAKKLGLEQVPAVRLGHLSEDERRAYTLADNKIALNATWDEDLLASELAAIMEAGIGAGLLGFGDDEVERLLASATGRTVGNTDPDAAPVAPKSPVATRGDLWALGRHRLLCGDCTSAEDTTRLRGGASPHLMVTDPPYGVNYDPAWRGRAGIGSEGAAVGKVSNDDRADWRRAWELSKVTVAYVWHGGLHAAIVAESLAVVGLKIRAQIVWVKTRPVISRGAYHWQHEPAYYATKDGEPDQWRFIPEHEIAAYAVLEDEIARWSGGRKQSTVWNIEHVKSDTGHGTQKPVECMKRPIENNSQPGDAVYDPFVGSGTTIIAAEMTARNCFALEIDPAYVDVCINRWQDFTGALATLEGDGRTFKEIAVARGVPLAA